MNTTNTILIILLVVLVGFGIWYFTATPPPTTGNTPTYSPPDVQVDVETPVVEDNDLIPMPDDNATPGM